MRSNKQFDILIFMKSGYVLTLNAPNTTKFDGFSSAEMFMKPLWQTV